MAVATDELTGDAIARRRNEPEPTARVLFQVAGLYGIAPDGMRIPLSETESFDSGQVCITLDPESPASSNIGIVDFAQRTLRVRYGVQCVFPGLHDLVKSGHHDPSLLTPPRAVATDDCTLTPDLSGWRALGCLEFLPGSLWAGAGGG